MLWRDKKRGATIAGIRPWRDLKRWCNATIAMVEVIGWRSARLSTLGLVEEKPLAVGGMFIVSGA